MTIAIQSVGEKHEADSSFTRTYDSPGQFLASTCPPEEYSLEAIEVEGEGLLLKPQCMTVDQPYPFHFSGKSLVAVKRADGAIDFYHLA